MNSIIELPGWTTKVDEISNGVYQVLLQDRNARKAEATDTDLDAAILKAQEFAFSIEKEISLAWSRFLFDLCIVIFDDLPIFKKYEEAHFGSWIVELRGKRIIYEGKDQWLISQLKKENKWFDILISSKENLTFEVFWNIISAITPNDKTP